jgi:hypothetical protein
MRKKLLIGGPALAGAVVAWYLFRPELLFVDAPVTEAFPAGAGASAPHQSVRVLAAGHFHGVAHEGRGQAAVHALADGTRVLRLTDLETSNGPSLYVYLVSAADAQDSHTVRNAAVLDLGPLKGNKGDQNYELPADADLTTYRAVTIWCRRFSVNFATAPLTAP